MKGKVESPISLRRWKGIQRRIGITGGIASGKTSVSNFLNLSKNIPVLDADIFAKNTLNYGTATSHAVLDRFGDKVKSKDKEGKIIINREELGKIIFSNSRDRLWLESLIHPIVENRLSDQLKLKENHPIIVLTVPLLFEAKLTYLCSEVWVVSCTEKQQFERLIARNNFSFQEAQKRIMAQWPLSKKMKYADAVINNKGGFQEWISQVNDLI